MALRRLEQMLIVAILRNSEEEHANAQQYARENNFTQEEINTACKKVTNFLKLQGVSTMLLSEKKALIKIQSFFRMLIVKKKLCEKIIFWKRLALIDDLNHLKKAEKINKILHPPRKKRKISV